MRISFLWLLKQVPRTEPRKTTNVFAHAAGGQKSEIKGVSRATLSPRVKGRICFLSFSYTLVSPAVLGLQLGGSSLRPRLQVVFLPRVCGFVSPLFF